jgi:hypothetical protein
MRKIFTLIIYIFVLSCLHAQIKKGSLLLGGNIGGATAKTKSADTIYGKQNFVNISPVFGKAIKDNLIVGCLIDFNLSEGRNYANAEQETNTYGAGIFLRKYRFLGNSGFSIFVQGNLGYNYYHYALTSPPGQTSYDSKRQTVYLNAYPGLSYTLTKKLQLETGFNNVLSLSYWHEKNEQKDTQASSFDTHGFSVGSSLNNLSNFYVGFRLLIGK